MNLATTFRDLPADPSRMTAEQAHAIDRRRAEAIVELLALLIDARETIATIRATPAAAADLTDGLTDEEWERMLDIDRRWERAYAALVAIGRYLDPVLRPFELGDDGA